MPETQAVDLVGRRMPGRVLRGAGRRGLRAWNRSQPCCPEPRLDIGPDGRMRCGGCGMWCSASHSRDRLVLARSMGPIGVDVQVRVNRLRAMRVLAEVAQLEAAGVGVEQWALAEATLKAAGRAGSVPGRGELTLPAAPTSRALPDEPFRLRIEAVGAESVGMPGVVGRAEQFTWGAGFVIALVHI
ncbi:hypothetical protein [Acidipropionibacterium thoenii]|uniref:hypothetical protein n=1 Tax=Acidipropionibacterium thoenii TaxID=1751 RepID=UPI000486A5C4|nr:hypothetical protein [Acidipropionibacterium thoenii]